MPDPAAAGRHGRSLDAARALHELQRHRAVRLVLDRARHRPTRRARPSARSRPHAGLIVLVLAGYVEYKFPNNAKVCRRDVEAVEFSLEMSSEVPGTNVDWPSDITALGQRASASGPGRRRAISATGAVRIRPRWWKLGGSQYGKLTNWRISAAGHVRERCAVSPVTLEQLDLDAPSFGQSAHRHRRATPPIPAASTSSAAGSAITTRTSSCASAEPRRSKSVCMIYISAD